MKRTILIGIVTLLLNQYPVWAETTNSNSNGVTVGGNFTAKVEDNGSIIIMTGGQITQIIDKESVEKLGVAKSAVSNFLKILQEQNIPLEDWDKKLREIAEDYQNLKAQTKRIQTNSLQGEQLKAQAEQSIEDGEFDQAEKLLNEIHQLNMQAAAQNILFAAEADAANGALAATRLQYQKSGEYYERAAQAMSALGEEQHAKWGEYLNGAGKAFQDAGQYTQALPLYEKALALREKHLPADHPAVALSLNNLAVLFQAQGQYDKAQPLYERSLGILEKVLGKDHPSTKTVRENYEILLEEIKQVKN